MLDYRDTLTKKISLHERQAAQFVKDAIERRRKGDQQGRARPWPVAPQVFSLKMRLFAGALLLVKRKKIHDAEVLQLRGSKSRSDIILDGEMTAFCPDISAAGSGRSCRRHGRSCCFS